MAGSVMKRLLLACASISILVGASHAAPWDEVSKARCGEFYDSKGSHWGPKTAALFTWIAGYRDGIAALSKLDKRFATVARNNLDEIGPMVLAICKAEPNTPAGEATTMVYEMMINMLPGERVDLTVPHSE